MAATDNFPLFVSYHTPDKAYTDCARKLAASLDRLGLEYRIETLPPKANWVENCAQKAEFVNRVLQEEKRTICWLDADCQLLSLPDEIRNFDKDFAVIAINDWMFHGAQIVFAYNETGLAIASRWAQYAVNYPHIWDQATLGYAWWDVSLEHKLETLWLKRNTMEKQKASFLSRLPKMLFSKPVFFQTMQSRQSRDKQGVITREFTSYDIPKWWQSDMINRHIHALSGEQLKELGLNDPVF